MNNGQSDVLFGCYAISKSGHDKNEVYVITAVQDGFCMVANGLNRTLNAPKRKNMRHLFITKAFVPDFEKLTKSEPVSGNLKLASLIKEYRQKQNKPGVEGK